VFGAKHAQLPILERDDIYLVALALMSHAALSLLVRDCVLQGFADLGVVTPDELRETVLIRGGMYCGRRYESEHGAALWFLEEDQLKFVGEGGSVLRVITNVSQWQRPLRMAA
jgi:hypothetical protein